MLRGCAFDLDAHPFFSFLSRDNVSPLSSGVDPGGGGTKCSGGGGGRLSDGTGGGTSLGGGGGGGGLGALWSMSIGGPGKVS